MEPIARFPLAEYRIGHGASLHLAGANHSPSSTTPKVGIESECAFFLDSFGQNCSVPVDCVSQRSVRLIKTIVLKPVLPAAKMFFWTIEED
jgi:hypothetical protein